MRYFVVEVFFNGKTTKKFVTAITANASPSLEAMAIIKDQKIDCHNFEYEELPLIQNNKWYNKGKMYRKMGKPVDPKTSLRELISDLWGN